MSFPSLVVTQYCERHNDTFWAEPINAITNLAFIMVALLLSRLLLRLYISFNRVWDIWLLVFLIVAAGVGSFMWHTLATTWAQWLDVTPIMIYIGAYLVSYLVRVKQASPASVFLWLFGFLALNLANYLLLPADTLNGSVYYLPSLLLLTFFTVGEPRLRIAVACFALSIVFRSVDQLVCPVFPPGTHFLWHLAIGLTVFFTTRVLIQVAAYNK